MLKKQDEQYLIEGSAGTLTVASHDEVVLKFAMLVEGECEGLGPTGAARKYGYSRQRYFQLRKRYEAQGSDGLKSQKRGPKGNSKRTDEVERQVIRHRFLDPDASAEVIAQKLRQCGMSLCTRCVYQIFEDYGLQKKTIRRST
jgi:transposase